MHSESQRQLVVASKVHTTTATTRSKARRMPKMTRRQLAKARLTPRQRDARRLATQRKNERRRQRREQKAAQQLTERLTKLTTFDSERSILQIDASEISETCGTVEHLYTAVGDRLLHGVDMAVDPQTRRLKVTQTRRLKVTTDFTSERTIASFDIKDFRHSEDYEWSRAMVDFLVEDTEGTKFHLIYDASLEGWDGDYIDGLRIRE